MRDIRENKGFKELLAIIRKKEKFSETEQEVRNSRILKNQQNNLFVYRNEFANGGIEKCFQTF